MDAIFEKEKTRLLSLWRSVWATQRGTIGRLIGSETRWISCTTCWIPACRCWGEKHPDLAVTCTDIGDTLNEWRYFEAAAEWYIQAANIYETADVRRDTDAASVYVRVGDAMRDAGDKGAARTWYETAVDRLSGIGLDADIMTARAYAGIALVTGDIQYATKAVEICEASPHISDLDTADLYVIAARVCLEKEDAPAANAWAKKALKIQRSILQPEDPRVVDTYLCKAKACEMLGDRRKSVYVG